MLTEDEETLLLDKADANGFPPPVVPNIDTAPAGTFRPLAVRVLETSPGGLSELPDSSSSSSNTVEKVNSAVECVQHRR